MTPRFSDRARTEAAAWVVCLHGDQRTPDAEAACRKWLAEDPQHAAAFEHVTDIWEKSGQLRKRPGKEAAHRFSGLRSAPWRSVFAIAAAASLAAIGVFFYLQRGVVTTDVGENRTVVLEDGSRVQLNTDTRIVSRFDGATRHVDLVQGEAFFEVAKNPQRPFIVRAGDQQVRALGTSFMVRRAAHDIEVTLVEGKVTVSGVDVEGLPAAIPSGGAMTAERQADSTKAMAPVVLAPGQRLTIAPAGSARVDRPEIRKVTAWQRGEVVLDDTPLADAVAEMNRYSEKQILVVSSDITAIRVGGVFKAGEQDNFAQALALAYQLELHVTDGTIVLGPRIAR